MKIDDTNSNPAELAALYAAGALPPDQAAAIESRLIGGDRLLAEEIASFETVLIALAEGAEPVAPNPATRAKLLEQVARMRPGGDRQTSGKTPTDELPAGIIIRTGEVRDWVDFGIPGVQACLLYSDTVRKAQTKLIRMVPGATLPAHPHVGFEECFMLEGDAQMYGRDLRAGDYMIAPPGSFHPQSHTKNGCVFLLIDTMHAEPGA